MNQPPAGPKQTPPAALVQPIVLSVPASDQRYGSFQKHYEAARAAGNMPAMLELRQTAQRMGLIK